MRDSRRAIEMNGNNKHNIMHLNRHGDFTTVAEPQNSKNLQKSMICD